jgi:uncharacterized membrane protein
MNLKKIALIILWAVVVGLSVWFYFDNVIVYVLGYETYEENFFANQLWFVAHILGASCSLLLGPIQFWKSIRTRYIRLHRISGYVYIIGSLIAAASAMRLSLIFNCVGCRYSLIPLSVLFFCTTALAWYAIQKRNIEAHRQFMVRSYTCSLAFVFVRLYQVVPIGFVFRPIGNPEVQNVVIEWTFSILPLLLVEVFMVWLPSLSSRRLSAK